MILQRYLDLARWVVLIVPVAIATTLLAQAPQNQPTFEVASIKVNNSGGGGSARFVPGRFTAGNVTLRQVIRTAYRVTSYQVVGGPDWIGVDRFDIEAKIPEGATEAQGPTLLQALLVDRFRLRVHKDTRELPIYALTVARSDGRLGTPIRPTQDDCAAILAARAKGESASFGTNEKPVCSERQTARPIPSLTLTYRAGGKTMASFAEWVQQYVDRPVLDRTQLPGMFDLELQFALETAGASAATVSQESPTIFVALREQLGLTLKAMNGPLDVVVVDSAEKPTPN